MRPELETTLRKVVTKYEVDAFKWECVMDNAASEIACDMHA